MVRISDHQIIFGADYTNWEGMGPGRIRWAKGVAEGASYSRYETAYCSLIDYEYTIPLLWSGMLQAKSLSEPMTQQGNKRLNEKRIHPCHKPILLYDAIYQKFGPATEFYRSFQRCRRFRVFDSHLGGGSNRISCEKQGFDFVAAEIDKEYFDLEEARFLQHKSKLRIHNW